MKCDICDEHVDPDDYQAHCEDHVEAQEAEPIGRNPWGTEQEWEIVQQYSTPSFYNLVSDEGQVTAYSLTKDEAERTLAAIKSTISLMREQYQSARRSSDMGWKRADEYKKQLHAEREQFRVALKDLRSQNESEDVRLSK
jgi:hypothetical protein